MTSHLPAICRKPGCLLQRAAVCWLGLLLLVAAYGLTYAVDPAWHQRWLRGEDHGVEWLTAIGFATASLLTALAFRFRARMDRWSRLYLAGLALFFFVCFGEEISWGQRVFGFATPETIQQANEQKEFNLHNLHLDHFSPLAMVSFLLTGFGLVAPVALSLARRPADGWERYVGPLWVAPCFLTAATAHSTVKALRGGLEAHFGQAGYTLIRADTQELAEMAWGLSCALAAYAIFRAWQQAAQATPPQQETPAP